VRWKTEHHALLRTDAEAREWMAALTPEDKTELKRQALLKRAIELTQPEKEPELGKMSQGEFEAYKRSLGIG
jgi:hypothetical protein